jgi:hypothetical protein
MRRLSVAWMVALATSGTATAQQLNVAASLTRVDASASMTVESSSLSATSNEPRAKRILDDPQAGDPTAVSSQILERLPINRLQRLLKKNAALRVAEAAVGATIVGYQLHRANADSTAGQIGVHAIRFGGADWLERSRFRVEPQIIRGGFVIYIKKNN